MTTDLYLSKEEQLKNWCKGKGFFSTADILRYATDNFYLRAKRTVNDLVKEGIVKIVLRDECIFRNLRGKMQWYAWIS